MNAPPRLSPSIGWAFSLGGAAVSASNQVVVVLLIRYLTDDLAVSAGLAALLFALTKIYDGFVDPIVGYVSDRTETRWGRRRPFLFASAIIMPLSIVGLFAVPNIESPTLLTLYLAFMMMLHGTGYSLYFVPAAAMSVEVTDDYHARSTLLTAKMYGFFVGQVLGSSVPPWLLAAWGGGRQGHAQMAVVLGAIIGILAMASVPLLRHARSTTRAIGLTDTIRDQFRVAWTNKPFRTMVFVHIVFMIGVATASSSNAYFTRYVLQRTDAWLGSFYIFLTIGNAVALPFWLWLSKRVDKKNAYVLALGLYGASVLSWMFAGPQDTLIMLGIRVTVIGAAMSGVVMLAQSMLTDAVRYDYIRSGLRREGAFSGFMSLIDKLSSAVGLMMMGSLLSSMGYAAGHSGGATMQSSSALNAIYASFALIPALTALVSVLLLRGYTLKETDLHEPSSVQPDGIAIVLAQSGA
jgi:GPH family glycoside/pentoside/hexuronide:cation symporter